MTTLVNPPVSTVEPILFLGNDNLYTNLLLATLNNSLPHTCNHILWETLGESLTARQLLLIDCSSYHADSIYQEFCSLEQHTPDFRAALLNIKPNSAHEELALWPQVKGIFYQDIRPDLLLLGLQEILNEGHWLPRRLSQQLLDQCRQSPGDGNHHIALTKREDQILQYLTQGSTNQEIAGYLHVSEHTVKSHLYNTFKKIGAKNRLQAYNWSKKYLP